MFVKSKDLIFSPLESPNIYAGDVRNTKHQLLIPAYQQGREGWVKALPFLAGFALIICLAIGGIPHSSFAQEINREGWPIPDLYALTPYSITVRMVDGVEKIIERFYTSDGGHVARISGNGKVYAYAVDRDQEPPIDYLLLDPDGLGKFTQRFGPKDSYSIPEWVSH
jgi:hypothetical protein